MKEVKLVFALIFFLLLILIIPSVISRAPNRECPIQSDTDIIIYGDTGTGGVGIPSRSWITHFMDWLVSYNPELNYVFLNRNDVKTYCNLSNYPSVKLYIQPGGNAYYQQNALGSSGKNNILNYLDRTNGSYLGICAGAFYAANDYYWQGSFYNWPNLLDRYPTVEGSITTIADYDSNPGYALTNVNAEEKSFNMIYYGGPTRGWMNTPTTSPGQQLLTYSSISGNLPASIEYNKMLLMSVHAEAYENDGITGLSQEQRIENYKWLANSINNLANTNLFVPDYAAPAACADNLDNDGDGLVDMNDPGCTSISDNDETNPTGPGIIFADNFESNTLASWTLAHVSGGNNWVIGTNNPYQGSRYAESVPQSTSEPASILSKSIDLSGYQTINVSYYRRLIALDSADEFKAKWFDGTNWNILEQTGSSSANDANYISKSFILPAGANNNPSFIIRFECTAGAVSEFCRVDNLQITSN